MAGALISLWLWLPAQNVARQHLITGWEGTNEALFLPMAGWLEVNGCWKQSVIFFSRIPTEKQPRQ